MENYKQIVLPTNEKANKVEQKFSRQLRKDIIAEMSQVFSTTETVGTKTYGILEFADNQIVTVEISCSIKSLDFEV